MPEIKQKVLNALQLVLRPIVKVLFRYGIGFSEFAETAKLSFVDVASSDFGIRGRPTNISRVAVMTGLTRKEVKRLRTKIESGNSEISVKSTPMAEVIHRWHSESEYLIQEGVPRPLPFSGSEHSFSDLVRRFGGDVPAGAMRTELKRVGCVVENDNSELVVVRRSVIPVDRSDNLIASLVHGVYPLMSTVAENSGVSAEEANLAQFSAYSVNIQKEDLAKLRKIAYDRLLGTAESFDDIFMTYESLRDSRGTDSGTTVAVGVYYFEERDDNAKYEW